MKTAPSFFRQVIVGVVVLAAMTVALGVAYPAAIWAVSRIDSASAEGSALADANGCVVGSSLIGVDPSVPEGAPDPYLHARVLGSVNDSMAPGDPAASAASNLGPNNDDLVARIEDRRQVVSDREGVAPEEVPVDALTGSGSGLDLHISTAYAAIQVPRIARETGLAEDRVRAIVDEHTAGRQLGFLGQERVNVPEVNVALGLSAPSCP